MIHARFAPGRDGSPHPDGPAGERPNHQCRAGGAGRDLALALLAVSVFVQVSLERQVERALEEFEGAVADWPEVMECYLMTGDADYLLRVVVADLTAYHRFLVDHLTRVPGVASIKSSFALKQVKYRTALPLER